MGDDDASVRDFMFGFNDSAFSDRELIIDILPESVTRPDSGDLHPPESGDESDYSTSSEIYSKARKFHVSSLVLAEKSPFFRKLFANGMMESKQRCVTMRIHASEENAFVELLKYMYSGTLTISSAPALLDALKLADRFEVISCMRLCLKLLAEFPMTTELAMLCLDFTSSTSRTGEVQLLSDATKRFLEDRYNDLDKVRDEIMEMPLAGIEVILSSDVLKVFSEDTIFDLVVEWIGTHSPNLEEQRNILSTNLAKYIRFPYMSLDKLSEALSCNILDNVFAHKAVVNALFFKIKTIPHHHHSSEAATSNYFLPYLRRNYERRPIKVLPNELVIDLDLRFDECAKLKVDERIRSDTFDFNGDGFYLYVGCSADPWGNMMFCVGFAKEKEGCVPFGIRIEFSSRLRGSNAYLQILTSGSKSQCFGNKYDLTFYEMPWLSFMDGRLLDSIDGYLFLKVKLRMQ